MPENATSGSLADALARLEVVADAVGLDPAAARIEGMALAAAVAESGRQAFVDWCEQVGEAPSAERFMSMAQHGRRWRGAPTALLHELALSRPAQAPAYARVLAEVCTGACTLGEPNQRVAGNAQAAAAAQLAAAPGSAPKAPESTPQRPEFGSPEQIPATPPNLDEPTDQPGLGSRAQDFARQAPEVLRNVLDQLQHSVRRQQDDLDRVRQHNPLASSLDLDPSVPIGPGAFAGLPGGPPATPPATPPPPVGNPTGVDDPDRAGNGQAQAPTAPAASSGDQPAEETPAEEPEPRSLEELLAELDGLTGLAGVKDEIHKQAAVLRIEGLRSKQGLSSPTVTRHLVFVGNPGTGKTTVARLVAGIYRALGLLSKGQLVEVDRSELVAGYLGQTAIKTAEVVKSAIGGVLFIDEAYSLSGDQYGTEAINTLVKEMEDNRDDLVVIVAGYPLPMSVFIAENPGLTSRFRTTIEFDDYTDAELEQIFTGMVGAADYDATEDTVQRFRELLGEQVRDSSFGNGRFARNCLEAAVGAHAWRLREVAEPTLADLRTLLPDDLAEADEDDDELPDLARLQPEPGQPLTAPDDDEDDDPAAAGDGTVDFGAPEPTPRRSAGPGRDTDRSAPDEPTGDRP
ncbi:AAA family ATPase [Naumannella sp. ID2617S]|nr:AAA family ATPase [Naumannella sp. ID2617S]